MNEPKHDSVDPTVQVVDCGAVVPLDAMVLQHGILLTHDGHNLVRLHLNVDAFGINGYHFEQVTRPPEVKEVVIRLIKPEKSKILMPANDLVIPGG